MVDIARKIVEGLYDLKANIYETVEVKKANGATSFEWVLIYKDVPCRCSFDRLYSAEKSDTITSIKQVIKLFIAPELKVIPGSRIELLRGGEKSVYVSSGEAAIYNTHQEIILEHERSNA